MYTVIFAILNPGGSGGENRLPKDVQLEAVLGSAVELFISAAVYDSKFTVPPPALMLYKELQLIYNVRHLLKCRFHCAWPIRKTEPGP